MRSHSVCDLSAGAVIVDALERFFADVESGAFPSDEETYHMTEESFAILRDLVESETSVDR